MAPKCIKFGRCGVHLAYMAIGHGYVLGVEASISQEIQTDGESTNQPEKMNVSCNLCLHTQNEIQCVSTRSILCRLAQINSTHSQRASRTNAKTGKLLTVIKSLPVCCRRIIALFVFCSSRNGEMVYATLRTNMIRRLYFGVCVRTLCVFVCVCFWSQQHVLSIPYRNAHQQCITSSKNTSRDKNLILSQIDYPFILCTLWMHFVSSISCKVAKHLKRSNRSKQMKLKK